MAINPKGAPTESDMAAASALSDAALERAILACRKRMGRGESDWATLRSQSARYQVAELRGISIPPVGA